jgi:hypothetical protein
MVPSFDLQYVSTESSWTLNQGRVAFDNAGAEADFDVVLSVGNDDGDDAARGWYPTKIISPWLNHFS